MSVATPWDCALRYLGQRNHSRFELEEKLQRRGFSAEEVEQAMARLDSGGLLDDTQFAIELTRSLVENRGASYRAVVDKLRRKGVDEASIEVALADLSVDDDYDRALEVAQRRLGKAPSDEQSAEWWARQRRRLLTYLGRRGFPESVCYRVIRQLEADNDY